jgi:hypothetical protein
MRRLGFYTCVFFIFLISCKKDEDAIPAISSIENFNDSLSGSKWVITRYDEGTTPYYPNDTINFVDNQKYKINSNGSLNNYTTYRVNGTYNISISLYSISTLGGSYAGQVPETFIKDGIINNATMKDLYGNLSAIKIWVKKSN